LAGAPDALWGGGHRHIGDAERGERVEDRVHHRRRRSDGDVFAHTFGAKGIRRARDRAESTVTRGNVSGRGML